MDGQSLRKTPFVVYPFNSIQFISCSPATTDTTTTTTTTTAGRLCCNSSPQTTKLTTKNYLHPDLHKRANFSPASDTLMMYRCIIERAAIVPVRILSLVPYWRSNQTAHQVEWSFPFSAPKVMESYENYMTTASTECLWAFH